MDSVTDPFSLIAKLFVDNLNVRKQMTMRSTLKRRQGQSFSIHASCLSFIFFFYSNPLLFVRSLPLDRNVQRYKQISFHLYEVIFSYNSCTA